MKERTSFEREVDLLSDPASRRPRMSFDKPKPDDGIEWKRLEGEKVDSAEVGHSDAAKSRTALVFRFPGRTDRRALILAGVHGTEPAGVDVANLIVTELRDALKAGRTLGFETIIIPRLIKRHNKASPRFVLIGKVNVEPNRNFPQPGESYATAHNRGKLRKDKAEFLDPQTGKPPVGEHASQRMLDETRILLRIIESFKPQRLASLHAHSLSCIPGDAQGIFVDPRGGLDATTGKPLTAEGISDDAFTGKLLDQGFAFFAANPLPRDTRKSLVCNPFSGHFRHDGTRAIHYSSVKRAAGTSLGDWAPATVNETPDLGGNRPGITTLTVEIPQYAKEAKSALEVVKKMYVRLLADHFLELQ